MVLLPGVLTLFLAGPMNSAPEISQTLNHIAEGVPREVDVYQCAEEATYDCETVFDYLNGGAEIYLTYDFQGVLARRYVHPDGPEILFDVFDMGKPEDAYGIFSHEQESGGKEFGQGSEYTPGLLRFWKNRFFVSVTATRLTEEATAAITGLGRSAADAITGEGKKPDILRFLPTEGLVENRVRYFHSFMALRQHYSLGWKDMLHMDHNVRGVLAEYLRARGDSTLLVVEYPDEATAAKGEEGFYSRYGPAKKTGAFQREEGKIWTLVTRAGPLLVIVLEAPVSDEARRLADGVMKRWKEAHDD